MASDNDRLAVPLGEPGEMVDVKCAYCYGRGKDPFGVPGPESNCAVCGGKGYNRVMAPYVPCAVCGGTGKVRGRRLTCTACKGRGLVTAKGGLGTCPQCRGTGRQPGSEYDLPCTLCGGQGIVDRGKQSASRAAEGSAHRRPGYKTPRSVTTRPAPKARQRTPPVVRPVSRLATSAPVSSVADQIAAHINNFGSVRPQDIQIIFALSPEEAERTLQSLTQARRVRQKEDGLYYPA